MTTAETATRALAQVSDTKTIRSLVEQAAQEIHINPELPVRIALTAIRLNPALAKCTPASFLGSLLMLGQLGLEPVNGQAYLLPFMNKRKIGNEWKSVPEVQLIIGYKGFVTLFYRHNAALSITTSEVCENDQFRYEYGTEQYLKHIPATHDRGKVVCYYAIANVRGEGFLFRVMSKEDCLAHGKKHSKTFDFKTGAFQNYSPWVREEDSMCRKTVLLQLAKYLPLSIEAQKAIEADETSRNYRAGIAEATDLTTTTNWKEPDPPSAPTTGYVCETCTLSITKEQYEISMKSKNQSLCTKCFNL